jgi:ribonuclease R
MVWQDTGVALMIDSATTADRDDAIRVMPARSGWQLTVHIADVVRGVAAGSDADRDALRRVATIYRGGTALQTMLPRAVEARLTLAEGRPCPSLAIRMSVGQSGTVDDVTICRGELAEAVALTYEQAGEAVRDAGHLAHHPLCHALDLAEALAAGRRRRGALAFHDLKQGILADEEGTMRQVGIGKVTGHLVVQEAMIAANAAVAQWAVTRDTLGVFRNHVLAAAAPPAQEFIEDVQNTLLSGNETLLQGLADRIALFQRPATYDPFARGHAGLQLAVYCHATSPLRRVSDLILQRCVLACLDGTPPPYEPAQLGQACELINAVIARRRAAARERDQARRGRELRTIRDHAALDASEFTEAVAYAAAGNLTSASLEAEIRRRGAQSQLMPKDMHSVLCVAGPGHWPVAKLTAAAQLAAAPEVAITVLSMYVTSRVLPAVRYESGVSGPSHRPQFTATASLTTADGRYLASGLRTGGSRKAAQRHAALSLLAVLAGIEDPLADHRDRQHTIAAESPQPASISPADNTAAQLINHLRQTGVLASYSMTTDSSDCIPPVFTAAITAWHTGLGKRVTVAGGPAKSKKAAQADAAACLVAEIGGHDPVRTVNEATVRGKPFMIPRGMSHLSVINHARNLGVLTSLTTTFETSLKDGSPVFTATISGDCPVTGQPMSGTATAPSKITARRNAAACIVSQLRELIQPAGQLGDAGR